MDALAHANELDAFVDLFRGEPDAASGFASRSRFASSRLNDMSSIASSNSPSRRHIA
jgi:hypothetical protein